MSIVKFTNPNTGITYAYESTPYYDPVKKQSRPKRTYLGRVDDVTGEIIPTTRKKKKSDDNSSKDEQLINDLKEQILKLKQENTKLEKQISDLEKERNDLRTYLIKLADSLKS